MATARLLLSYYLGYGSATRIPISRGNSNINNNGSSNINNNNDDHNRRPRPTTKPRHHIRVEISNNK